LTRINCIPPSELSGPHLVAEYRELPRIFGLARAALARGERPDDRRNPTIYTLGKGHVRFFYPRLGFLVKRQATLIVEMKQRGYRPNFTDPERLLDGIPKEWCADWIPDYEAIALNRQRIKERSTGR
jgi:deoxyribonuclease (pyrimidine dimer)